MKYRLFYVLGLFALGLVALAASPAKAATAAGPYYALPSWDQQLPSDTRFIVLSNWGGAAVLDRETGLVWEQAPSGSALSLDWVGAQRYCNLLALGNRKGWRLPTVQELSSLIDPSVPSSPGPTLPAGHPFSNVQAHYIPSSYWSATTDAGNTIRAWTVVFWSGFGSNPTDTYDKSYYNLVWCVRGGHGVDAQ